ncbi:MAG: 2-aminoethylphosphonate--pyruvate transaminase [Bacteriovorax sp.]|nr:2-aminoethylphosphonate--pyruvate transaminase [Bacteriovorax sp.]
MKQVKRNILLNPGPATTTDTVKNAMVVSDICPRELEFGELTLSVRNDLIKAAYGEKNHTCVMLTSSGTGGVEACLTSVIPHDKKVLILNNGAYGERMQKICDAYSVGHVDYNQEWGFPLDLNAVEKLLQEHLGEISHLAFIHHETTVGILNPLTEISALSQKYKVETIVDAMSSFAGMMIDVEKDNIHYLVSSSNKCIQGMAGISFVIANTKSLLKTGEIKARNFYFNLLENHLYLERNKQFLFTPPVQTLYALRQAVTEYFEEGPKNRFARYASMYEIMKKKVRELGFEFLIEEKYHAKLLTAIMDPKSPDYSFNEMHDYLFERGFTIYPGKVGNKNTFRLSNIGAIYPKDIEDFLKVFEEYLRIKKII